MKKIIILIIVLILITGCDERQNLDNKENNEINKNINQDLTDNKEKSLVCSLLEKDKLEKTTKYIFDFDESGNELINVTLSLSWKGNLKDSGITKNGIERMFIDKNFIHDKYEIKNINENEIEFIASRKIKTNDKTILGDLKIAHDETYNSVLKEMTNHSYKCD